MKLLWGTDWNVSDCLTESFTQREHLLKSTYGDVVIENGQMVPKETYMTNASEISIQARFDYILKVERKTPTNRNFIELNDIELGRKRPG